ncbi:hypothetical protein FRC07_010022 [Ceratobasidium sp. 392]|nr:hypothetical protein FRC07_010022 [Ceratobasidium sp. 392]
MRVDTFAKDAHVPPRRRALGHGTSEIRNVASTSAGTGTGVHLSPVQYLQSFPSIQAAGSLVEYVLGASDVRAPPPSNTSTLFNLTSSMEKLPVLEVALFGTVGPDDLSAAVAGFANANGELFFVSSDADAFRAWAVQRAGSVVWADGALAQQVVREASRDQTFELVWEGANKLLQNAQTIGTKTSRSEVQQVVDAFGRIGYLGS